MAEWMCEHYDLDVGATMEIWSASFMAQLHSKNADLSEEPSINGALNCDEFIIRRWLDETW